MRWELRFSLGMCKEIEQAAALLDKNARKAAGRAIMIKVVLSQWDEPIRAQRVCMDSLS